LPSVHSWSYRSSPGSPADRPSSARRAATAARDPCHHHQASSDHSLHPGSRRERPHRATRSVAYARNTSTAIMGATVQLGRPIVLVIHDEGDALDLMTRLFEASGAEVVTAVTGFRAQAHLEGDR